MPTSASARALAAPKPQPSRDGSDQLRALRDQNLSTVALPETAELTDPLIAFIVFMQETTDWRLPIIDRDPAVPLSETNPIAPYDGSHNYLWWLTQASRDDLTAQRFVDGSGTAVAAPTALLYVMLRHAVLAALEAGRSQPRSSTDRQLFGVIDRDPLIANIGDVQHVQRRDYLTVDASRLGLASTPHFAGGLDARRFTPAVRRTGARCAARRGAAGDHGAGQPANRPVGAAVHRASGPLLVSTRRVDNGDLRAAPVARRGAQQKRAFHLGTLAGSKICGRTANRMAVPTDALPQVLRDAAGPRIFRDFTNGGYLHAPSLAQAASAAVLRNGNISHAGSAPSRTFAVDLSSARMRAATALADGVRAGQSMAALLGYQFERGLHEGHPGLELDRFIGLFRDRFPLVSGRLTEIAQGTNADLVEARNVVDGLALVEATSGQAYPYGISRPPGSVHGRSCRDSDRDPAPERRARRGGRSAHVRERPSGGPRQSRPDTGRAAGHDVSGAAARAGDHPHASHRAGPHVSRGARARCRGGERLDAGAVAARPRESTAQSLAGAASAGTEGHSVEREGRRNGQAAIARRRRSGADRRGVDERRAPWRSVQRARTVPDSPLPMDTPSGRRSGDGVRFLGGRTRQDEPRFPAAAPRTTAPVDHAFASRTRR